MKDVQRARHRQDIQLRFIERHVPQCQTGKYSRQNDKDGNETCKDDELRRAFLHIPFGERMDPESSSTHVEFGVGFLREEETGESRKELGENRGSMSGGIVEEAKGVHETVGDNQRW